MCFCLHALVYYLNVCLSDLQTHLHIISPSTWMYVHVCNYNYTCMHACTQACLHIHECIYGCCCFATEFYVNLPLFPYWPIVYRKAPNVLRGTGSPRLRSTRNRRSCCNFTYVISILRGTIRYIADSNSTFRTTRHDNEQHNTGLFFIIM